MNGMSGAIRETDSMEDSGISISRNHNRRSGQDIPGNRESKWGQRFAVPEDRSHSHDGQKAVSEHGIKKK